MDKLYSCAQTFNELITTTEYEFHLGSKNQLATVNLNFKNSDFYHLAGLQYIQKDVYELKGNKERIFKEILKGNITYDDIKKSNNLSFFTEREQLIGNLESFIDNFRNPIYKKVSYIIGSEIQADFIFNKEDKYYFTIKRSSNFNNNIYALNSLFKNTSKKYIEKQQRYTILLLNKINKVTQTHITLFNNPSYK